MCFMNKLPTNGGGCLKRMFGQDSLVADGRFLPLMHKIRLICINVPVIGFCHLSAGWMFSILVTCVSNFSTWVVSLPIIVTSAKFLTLHQPTASGRAASSSSSRPTHLPLTSPHVSTHLYGDLRSIAADLSGPLPSPVQQDQFHASRPWAFHECLPIQRTSCTEVHTHLRSAAYTAAPVTLACCPHHLLHTVPLTHTSRGRGSCSLCHHTSLSVWK